ncbi:MAG: hypothetical protein VYE16_06750 [Cyanobacteriota bacterium]|nr:hypothetical protein [Cyanobacteriota bacterium]
MKARRQAAERGVVQNMRLIAFCSAKHTRVVLHALPTNSVVFAPTLSAFDNPLG